MPNEEELWAAQLQHWPDSVKLTPDEVIAWAWDRQDRCRTVLLSISKPTVVWYRTPNAFGTFNMEYRGFRYGIEGHEYMGLLA